MVLVDATYAVQMGFTSASQAFPDPDRPPLLRARPRAATPYGRDGVEVHVCDAVDLARDDTVQPDVFTFSFDTVDLADLDTLQNTCGEIDRVGSISDEAGQAIRSALEGAVLRGSCGRRLTVLHVADEGLIMRTAGPNRLPVGAAGSKGMNGHGPATSVHSDQDVHGTPLVRLMDGKAPRMFRHDSPDSHNHDASLMLVNLWIPIHQITQPLVLADGRSVDRLSHQLRFGLATESFLDREDDQTVNDIWTFLHAPDQRWYFRSEMDHREAYVFDTLSTPHGSAILPGEDVAQGCYLALEAAERAVEAGDAAEIDRVLAEAGDISVPERATPALAAAIHDMAALLDEAAAGAVPSSGSAAESWLTRSRSARRRVVRMSVELRMVVSVDG